MANYYTYFSFEVTHLDPENCRSRLLSNADFLTEFAVAAGYDDMEDVRDVARKFLRPNHDKTGFWLHDDLGRSPEEAIVAAQWILKDQQSPISITFATTYTCDKPRLDAYGGGLIVLNANSVASLSTNESWVHAMLEARLTT